MNTGTIVLIVVLILLVLLWFTKLGARVEYGEDGVRVQVRVGLIYVTVFPRPKKEKPDKPKKEKKPKKPKKKKPEKSKKKNEDEPEESALKKVIRNTKKYAGQAQDYFSGGSGGELGVILDAIPEVIAILGDTIHRLIIDELTLHYTIAGRNDAAGAAMQYGIIHSTGGAVWELLEHNFRINKRSVTAEVDFNEPTPKVWARVCLVYTFGDLMIIAFHLLKEGLKVLIGWKKAKSNRD